MRAARRLTPFAQVSPTATALARATGLRTCAVRALRRLQAARVRRSEPPRRPPSRVLVRPRVPRPRDHGIAHRRPRLRPSARRPFRGWPCRDFLVHKARLCDLRHRRVSPRLSGRHRCSGPPARPALRGDRVERHLIRYGADALLLLDAVSAPSQPVHARLIQR
jgi:hypothetical protein